jgi:hypothetical protein
VAGTVGGDVGKSSGKSAAVSISGDRAEVDTESYPVAFS